MTAALIFMAVALLSPPFARLIDLPLIQKKAPRTNKSRVPRLHGPPAAVGTRSIGEDAARRADPQRHQRRHRERRVRAGSASAILAGPGSPTWCCPGHGALGI